jgi:hypothetical protein
MHSTPDGRIVIPWYSPALFARLRTDLVDGRASLDGSYEQWCQRTASQMQALRHGGHVVLRVDADTDALDAFLEAPFDEPDYGGWREFLARTIRR